MPLPNRPSNAVLDPTSAYYANIVSCINFSDGSGNTATALAGSNLTIGGVANTAFSWLAAELGGGAVHRITTDGTLKFPGFTGSRAQGTIIMVVRKHAAAGGPFWHTGSTTMGGGSGFMQGTALLSGFSHGDGSLENETSANILVEDEWQAVVFTWQSGTKMEMYYEIPVVGKVTIARDPIPSQGFVLVFANPECVAGGVAAGVGGVDAASYDIAYWLRLNTVLTAGDEDDYLSDPFLNLMEEPVAGTGPVVVIASPADDAVIQAATVEVTGTAGDNDEVVLVEYRVNGGDWAAATITLLDPTPDPDSYTWYVPSVALIEGENTISVRATDDQDDVSEIVTIVVTRESDSFLGNHGIHWRGRTGAIGSSSWDGINW